MSAEKIFGILDLYNQTRRQLTVSEISNLMDIPQSSVYRHVRVLKENGFLYETSNGDYKLGYRFLDFANIVRLDNSLSEIALPIMKELTNQFKETTILSVISDNFVVCVETVSSPQAVTVSSEQGKIIPLYVGGSSKAILAFQPNDLVDELFNKNLVVKHTENTLATKDELKANLKEIREKGYSVSDSEIDLGVYAYGFPIKNSKQKVFASLAIAGPKERMQLKSEHEIVEKFIEAINKIEKYL
ncbi:IclR family transcriptional regulator [Virgibacillus byunsanensis]|uniref:IclR family transcriptional regulator n=1 Tax=Virgibacillus byunsanensis TaxID=570945 RepID=A0ABW3LNX1_9BACI